MLSRVLRTIRRNQLFDGPGADAVLCAVSGGPDSMALLACLWELAPRLGLRLEVATVDHGLRAEAAGEIELVGARAAVLGLPWHLLRVDVKGARARTASGGSPGSGVQETARRLRLAALADLAARRGLGRVAIGHQADDQSETVLFRILRGTGIAGLAGIPYRRGSYVRPMLDVTRAEVLRYLERRSLAYVTDRSNADLRYARARMRHQLLPLLRRENPRLDHALRSLAASAIAEGEGDATRSFSLEASAVGVHVPLALAAEIRAAAREGHGTRSYDLPGGRQVTVAYGRVALEAKGRASSQVGSQAISQGRSHVGSQVRSEQPTTAIPGPGQYRFGPRSVISVREEVGADPTTQEIEGDTGRWVWFDGERLAWPLAVRCRRPGDRMRLRGGVGSRKLSDLLIDAKVPRRDRAELPITTTFDGEVLFVPGLRASRVAEPSAVTERWIGLAVVSISDHDALVDPSVGGGNTETSRILKRFAAKSMRG